MGSGKRFDDYDILMQEVNRLVAQGKMVSYRPATEMDGFEGWLLFA